MLYTPPRALEPSPRALAARASKRISIRPKKKSPRLEPPLHLLGSVFLFPAARARGRLSRRARYWISSAGGDAISLGKLGRRRRRAFSCRVGVVKRGRERGARFTRSIKVSPMAIRGADILWSLSRDISDCARRRQMLSPFSSLVLLLRLFFFFSFARRGIKCAANGRARDRPDVYGSG